MEEWREMNRKNGGKCASHVPHVSDSHVRHVRVSHVRHVSDHHVRHVRGRSLAVKVIDLSPQMSLISRRR